MLSSCFGRLARVAVLCGLVLMAGLPATAVDRRSHTPAVPPAIAGSPAEVVLEDFTDMVTSADLGANDFAGNMGTLNKENQPYGHTDLVCPDSSSCALRFAWDFGISTDPEAFTGIFAALFGLTDTIVSFDGTLTQTLAFPEHTLDLDQIDGALNEPGGPRSVQTMCADLTYQSSVSGPVQVRVELKDTHGGLRFTRIPLANVPAPQPFCWDFRAPGSYHVPSGSPDLDLHAAKQVTFIIERTNVADGVQNPIHSTISLHRIWFTLNRDEVQPAKDADLLDLIERRTYQYFLDWSSRKAGSQDIPQDRSTFGDLLTVGGIGFGLPAHVIAAERGWIVRSDAAARTLNVLRALDNPDAFGPEPVGRIGYHGWFYHFLGTDGKRKRNFDVPATPQKNESLNTVELSTIDTGLALMGVLAAQSYFDRADPVEAEIRARAQAIYDRVDWRFMLEANAQQFYLGWKPNEPRDGPPFAIPDPTGAGAFSGTPGHPQTLDFYTDEALIVILLALGSPETTSIPSSIYHGLALWTDHGLIKSYPGSLFTYLFLPAFLDTRTLAPPQLDHMPISWYDNTRTAILRAIAYASDNPKGFQTYGPDAWGISAAEGPFDDYHAYGAPPLAVASQPEEDGTVTYYAMLSAANFGDDLRAKAVSAARRAWNRDQWHPRFGLPDAFNDQISQATPPATALRQNGPWVQRALFAIDQGPMLLNLENARSGLIWNLLARNPNIQRALRRLAGITQFVREGEAGQGDGQIMPRSEASGQQTVWLHAGETRRLTLTVPISTTYTFALRYSNDNANNSPSEVLRVTVDGRDVGQVTAWDTGGAGLGWNVFVLSGVVGSASLTPGAHQVAVLVSGGDGFGTELDAVVVTANLHRQLLPVVLRASSSR